MEEARRGGISNDFVDAIFELFVILAICTLAISRLYKLDFENTTTLSFLSFNLGVEYLCSAH